MTDFSDYLEEGILDYLFRNVAAPSQPGSVYVALFTASPGEDYANTANEVSAGTFDANYARVGIGVTGGVEWTDPSADTQGQVDNSSVITFNQATDVWGAIGTVALFDGATTTDNLLFFGELNTLKTIGSADQFQFGAGDLDIQLQ